MKKYLRWSKKRKITGGAFVKPRKKKWVEVSDHERKK